MREAKDSGYPLERQAEYVAALAAVGGVFAYISWAIVSSLLPEGANKPDLAIWTATGAGLGGLAAVVWLVSAEVLH
jgi:hypothetical protein